MLKVIAKLIPLAKGRSWDLCRDDSSTLRTERQRIKDDLRPQHLREHRSDIVAVAPSVRDKGITLYIGDFIDTSLNVLLDTQGILNAGPSTKSQTCLLYTSPSPRDQRGSRMPSSA